MDGGVAGSSHAREGRTLEKNLPPALDMHQRENFSGASPVASENTVEQEGGSLRRRVARRLAGAKVKAEALQREVQVWSTIRCIAACMHATFQKALQNTESLHHSFCWNADLCQYLFTCLPNIIFSLVSTHKDFMCERVHVCVCMCVHSTWTD